MTEFGTTQSRGRDCDTRGSDRRHRGRVAYHEGQAAEGIVERYYQNAGMRLFKRRWRGKSGEIDLIFVHEETFVFVEVKKSQSLDRALHSLKSAQIRRICSAAEEFVAGCPKGALTDTRFDVAVVDGVGVPQILENALA